MATEKRLIDANEIEELFYKQVEYGATDLMDAFDDTLQDAQTVDAVEVVHSRFVRIADFGDGEGCFGYCEKCGTVHHSQSPVALKADYRWCRWCGAKMDGDGNE